MAGLELVLLLLAVSAGLRLIAERLTIPYAAILVVGGLLIAFIPGLPRVTLPPDVLFLVFVPPLLYWGAVSFPLRDFRRQIGPIVRLAVVLVLVSTAAVAVVAHTLHPSFTWAAAITLGAIVSPPDPVAVLSVTRSLRAPRWIESILEGEGLVNDATALVIYRLAVAAAVTGNFSPSHAALDFLLAGAGGIAIGLLVGVIVARVQRVTRSVPAVSITVSLLTPFASYLRRGARRRVGSPVGGRHRHVRRPYRAETRWPRDARAVLLDVDGRHLHARKPRLHPGWPRAPVRPARTRPLSALDAPSRGRDRESVRRSRATRVGDPQHVPLPVTRPPDHAAATSLCRRGSQSCSSRGPDSAAATRWCSRCHFRCRRHPARASRHAIKSCSSPSASSSSRSSLQGPTLAPLLRRLGLGVEEEEAAEESHARLAVAEAGLRKLEEPAIATSPYPEVVRYLRQRHRQRARRWAAREAQPHEGKTDDIAHDHFVPAPSHEAGALDEHRAAEYRRVRSAMLAAEQNTVLALRDDGVIADDVMRRIQRDLDLETMLLETSEPVSETVSDVPSAIDAASR